MAATKKTTAKAKTTARRSAPAKKATARYVVVKYRLDPGTPIRLEQHPGGFNPVSGKLLDTGTTDDTGSVTFKVDGEGAYLVRGTCSNAPATLVVQTSSSPDEHHGFHGAQPPVRPEPLGGLIACRT